MPPLRRIDPLVAKIDGDIEVSRVPLGDTQVVSQAQRLGILDELGPELACELSGTVGVNRAVRMKRVGGEGDNSDRGENDQNGAQGPSFYAWMTAEFEQRRGADAREEADRGGKVLHDPRGAPWGTGPP